MLRNEQEEEISLFGIYFCSRCENFMTPSKGNGLQLDFKCLSCGVHELDFSDRRGERCMLYSKEINMGTPFFMQPPKRRRSSKLRRSLIPSCPPLRLNAKTAGTIAPFTSSCLTRQKRKSSFS